MKVYLASAWGTQQFMRNVRQDLYELGHEVTARWIDIDVNQGDGVAQFGTDEAARHASTDLEDIDNAEAVILFTKVFSTTGGYFTEFGYTLGSKKPVVVVGPLRNIFMGAPRTSHFETYETFIEAVRQDVYDRREKEREASVAQFRFPRSWPRH